MAALFTAAALLPPCDESASVAASNGINTHSKWTLKQNAQSDAGLAALPAAIEMPEQPFAAAPEATVERLRGELQHSQASYVTVLRALHRKVNTVRNSSESFIRLGDILCCSVCAASRSTARLLMSPFCARYTAR